MHFLRSIQIHLLKAGQVVVAKYERGSGAKIQIIFSFESLFFSGFPVEPMLYLLLKFSRIDLISSKKV